MHELLPWKIKRLYFPSRKLPFILFVIACTIIIAFYSKLVLIQHLQQKSLDNIELLSRSNAKSNVPLTCSLKTSKPKYHLSAKNSNGDYLKHIRNAFTYLGFEKTETFTDSWDVLWAYDYPYPSIINTNNLNSHQRVNHVPGFGYLTSKVFLATSKFKFIPKAFSLPNEKDSFLTFANQHEHMLWVQKSNKHRGITIKSVNKLDLTVSDSFVQEYVQNPCLVDGRKFDIGIYVVITSIDPLRLYALSNEWLIRYCPENYYPFDSQNPNKYVVGDNYTPTWKLPSLTDMYTKFKFSHKKTLLNYLSKQGHDVTKIEHKLFKAIVEITLDKKPNIMKSVSRYPFGSKSFFELVRFDFVLDSFLNVHLMEVNMSPNLSSAHFPQNAILYEQVMLNTLSLVGLSRSLEHGKAIDDALINNHDIQVYDQECLLCSNCDSNLCKLCFQCISDSAKIMIKNAYVEHLNRVQFVRIFPATSYSEEISVDHNNLSNNDLLMQLWYKGKCLENKGWC